MADLAIEGAPGRVPRSRRAGLWRAIAGMAVALAIACLTVAIEMSKVLLHRTSHYNQKIETLSRKVDALKHEAAANEKRLDFARKELQSRDRMQAILLAPDLRKIKLAPLNQEEVQAGSVSLSHKLGGAVLKASGLPAPPEGQVYAAWWVLKNAPAAKAAEFRSQIDGTATAYLDLPPAGDAPVAFEVTLEPSRGGMEPGGAVRLRGHAQ